ncbi:MAG: hypothetical protein FJ272_03440, partial [Planctomycetes bacterium]|nr:hypothetical protein [Planctomycetota bacterium]
MKKIAVTALLGVLLATQLALAQVGIFGRGGRTGIVGASITPETADVGEECILTVQIAQGKTPFDKLILGSSDPKVVQVPSEVALLAGQTVVTVKVRALAPGAARINLAVG